MNGFHRETELEFSLEGDRVIHKEEGRKEPLGPEPPIPNAVSAPWRRLGGHARLEAGTRDGKAAGVES